MKKLRKRTTVSAAEVTSNNYEILLISMLLVNKKNKFVIFFRIFAYAEITGECIGQVISNFFKEKCINT